MACPQKRVIRRKRMIHRALGSFSSKELRDEWLGSDTGRGFSSLKTEYAGCRCRIDMPPASMNQTARPSKGAAVRHAS